MFCFFFFFSSRRRHTRSLCDWSSDVCSSDLQSLGLLSSFAGEVSARLGRRVAAGPMPNLRTLKIRNAKTQMPQPTARVTPSTRPGASVDPPPPLRDGSRCPSENAAPVPMRTKDRFRFALSSPYAGGKAHRGRRASHVSISKFLESVPTNFLRFHLAI